MNCKCEGGELRKNPNSAKGHIERKGKAFRLLLFTPQCDTDTNPFPSFRFSRHIPSLHMGVNIDYFNTNLCVLFHINITILYLQYIYIQIQSSYRQFVFFFLLWIYSWYSWYIVDIVSDVQQSNSVKHLYTLSDSLPFCVITMYWTQFLVLYSRSLLFIYFMYRSVYLFISNSLFTLPPTPTLSPLETRSLFSMSLSLFLFCK